jgi:hypothetical protein
VFTLIFWQATAERAVKSFAQALAAMFGTGGVGLLHVAWTTSLSVAGMTALLSVLTSLSGIKVGDVGMPSLVSRAPSEHDDASTAPEPRLARA